MASRMGTISQKTILSGCALLVLLAATGLAQNGLAQSAKAPAGDWPSYDHDPASTRYSLLKQINTNNVATLKSAWTLFIEG